MKKLSDRDGKLFFQIWIPMLVEANKKYRVSVLDNGEVFMNLANPSVMKSLANKIWMDDKFIDEYLAKSKNLSPEERSIIQSWKRRVSGFFIIVRLTNNGAIMIGENNDVYQVLGLQSTWDEMIGGRALPLTLETTLLPFKNSIVSDGLVSLNMVQVGPNMTKSFNATYRKAVEEEKVIKSL